MPVSYQGAAFRGAPEPPGSKRQTLANLLAEFCGPSGSGRGVPFYDVDPSGRDRMRRQVFSVGSSEFPLQSQGRETTQEGDPFVSAKTRGAPRCMQQFVSAGSLGIGATFPYCAVLGKSDATVERRYAIEWKYPAKTSWAAKIPERGMEFEVLGGMVSAKEPG